MRLPSQCLIQGTLCVEGSVGRRIPMRAFSPKHAVEQMSLAKVSVVAWKGEGAELLEIRPQFLDHEILLDLRLLAMRTRATLQCTDTP
jgi:hypothetical protein